MIPRGGGFGSPPRFLFLFIDRFFTDNIMTTNFMNQAIQRISLVVVIMLLMAWTNLQAQFSLTLLHNNDAESQLVSASGQPDFGGAARFKALVDQERAAATTAGNAVVTVTSGDNYIPSPEFNASLALPAGTPYYDALLIDAVGYDALCLGNHDFDFGPGVLGNLIGFTSAPTTFLSANLDVSAEPALSGLASSGRIASSTIVNKNGRDIGIIGLTTPNLGFISSPGPNVVVDQNIVAAAQAEIAALQGAGVNIIILISHLQGVAEDQALLAQIDGVDIVVAGGGDELLAQPGTPLVPGDAIQGPYPRLVADQSGDLIPVVTTAGELKYLGRLDAEFDAAGNLISIGANSNAIRVSGVGADAVTPDAAIQSSVVTPVANYVAGLASNIIATTQVDLNGIRNAVRGAEQNQGNLIADAFLFQANQLAASFGVGTVDVALANGGGIRNNNIIAAGSDISELTTFDILPFGNLVSVVEGVSPQEFKDILENAYSRFDDLTQGGTGRFAQVAGFEVDINPQGQEQVTDNNGNIIVPGNRIVDVTLANGTKMVENGQVNFAAPAINIAIPDFLARGGDEYPITSSFTVLGVTGQQALANYLTGPLGGVVTAAQYPAGGENRIDQGSVVIDILPDTSTVGLNQFFTVDVALRADSLPVDGFFFELSFDPSILQVANLTEQATAEFPTSLLPPIFNNATGEITYSRGTFSNFPTDSILVLTIEFQAVAPTTGTDLSFVGFTDVTFGGSSVLSSVDTGTVVVRDLADVTINYSLQGRTDFSGNENGNFFTVELYEPGTTNLVFSFPGLTGTPTGELTISNVFVDEYDFWVKHTKYLARLVNGTLSAGSNTVNAGELRAGDANNDNLVLLPDFSILVSTFARAQGDLGYNENADFNADGAVTLVDFSLLVTNFNTAGAVPGGPLSLRVPALGPISQSVNLNWVYDREQVRPGELVTARLMVNAGTQLIDGVEAHLSFDPAQLEVVEANMIGKFDLTLLNRHDNEAGLIDLAAGSLTNLYSGEFQVAEVTFLAKAEGAAQVAFQNRAHLIQNATYGGQSVLNQTTVQPLVINHSTTSVKALSAELGMNVYPVPSRGQFTVKINATRADQNMTLRIYDMAGKVVASRQVLGVAEQQFDLSMQPAGIYRIQLTDGQYTVSQHVSIQ